MCILHTSICANSLSLSLSLSLSVRQLSSHSVAITLNQPVVCYQGVLFASLNAPARLIRITDVLLINCMRSVFVVNKATVVTTRLVVASRLLQRYSGIDTSAITVSFVRGSENCS